MIIPYSTVELQFAAGHDKERMHNVSKCVKCADLVVGWCQMCRFGCVDVLRQDWSGLFLPHLQGIQSISFSLCCAECRPGVAPRA